MREYLRILVAATALLVPAHALAQDEPIEAGIQRAGAATVSILDDAGRTVKGRIIAINPGSITFGRSNRSTIEIPITAIRRIERRGDPPWGGLKGGAALGAGFVALWWSLESLSQLKLQLPL